MARGPRRRNSGMVTTSLPRARESSTHNLEQIRRYLAKYGHA